MAELTLRQLLEDMVQRNTRSGRLSFTLDLVDGNGERLRARARTVRVAPSGDLLAALRQLLGPDAVTFVRAG